MTLLGFSMGTAPPASGSGDPVNMSLDDMIASRQRQSSKPAAPRQAKKPVKSVTNADRSIGTARAKREAAMAARRGLSASSKPTRMDIEREVTKQAGKTAAKAAKSAAIAAATTALTHETGASRADKRRQKRSAQRAAAAAAGAAAAGGGGGPAAGAKKGAGPAPPARPPPRKAVAAAVAAMERAGFKVPQGMQVVISLAPAQGPPASSAPRSSGKQQLPGRAGGGGRGAGGGGRGGPGGGGGGPGGTRKL